MEIKELKAPFEKYLNMVRIESKDGYAKIMMLYRQELTNPHGSLHGGVLASLADTAMAVAIVSKYPDATFYTTKLEIKFKSSADKGNIFAEARLVDKRRNFVFGEVKIRNDRDRLLAQASVTFYLKK